MDRPLIILGAPRSGTSILGDILAEHPDLYYAVEPSPVWRYGNEAHSDLLKVEMLTPAVKAYIVSYFEKRVRESGAKRLLEKTPQNCLRVPFVEAVFPDACYIYISRDPVETILSIRRMWETNTKGFKGVRLAQRLGELRISQMFRYGSQFVRRLVGGVFGTPSVLWGPLLPGLSSMRRELDTLEVAALQWRCCVERLVIDRRSIPAERFFECRLEQFDRTSLSRVLDFAGLEMHDNLEKAFETRFTEGSISSRATALSVEEMDRIMRWIEPTLSWLDRGR